MPVPHSTVETLNLLGFAGSLLESNLPQEEIPMILECNFGFSALEPMLELVKTLGSVGM